ncbi:MAG: hypothetical protein A2539_06235 [Elusimicrobia bacterium RIFOXYD2_FULL_34_15]|nr:MAG: hypothetical protein A2539_06235 [Elusimicrobia bacterium RIFOXYD2_FULL_34_15]
MAKATPYLVYILKCSNNTLYTGITTDLNRRINEHNKGNGAKYTSNKIPVKCVYSEKHPNRSSALKRESEIKSLPRSKKLVLIKT